jgi:hypothetical protein
VRTTFGLKFSFIPLHFSQGTDITEAFESFHITEKASKMLHKFFVRDAKDQRSYKFTYDEGGFFRTLKRRAAERLETLDTSVLWKSKILFDLNFVILFVAAVFAAKLDNFFFKFFLILASSLFISWLGLLSHNFVHQRDNWRMFGSNFIMFGYGWREWRVFHALVSGKNLFF